MDMMKHAGREFKLAGWEDGDDSMQNLMMDNVKELLLVFNEQGHSGFSAKYCLKLFETLANFGFIGKLTGADEEWNKCEFSNVYQNKRFSSIFKDEVDGEAYWINGKVFSDDGGRSYCTNSYSRVPVNFPITMDDLKTEYIVLK